MSPTTGRPGFGDDPLVAGRSSRPLVVFAFLVVITLFTIWAERRVVARMQQRIGPNRVGPFGLLQSLADGIKLALKEDIIPKAADKVVFILAPIISATPALPRVRGDPVRPRGVDRSASATPLQLTDLPVAVLYILAVASRRRLRHRARRLVAAARPTRCSAALRSSAQMISYEIAMGLSFVAVFLYAGSMSTSRDRRRRRSDCWFARPAASRRSSST